MTLQEPAVDTRASSLRDALGDRILLPGDAGYDQARVPWNVAVDQHPFAVALPESAEDVVAVVRAAVGSGLRVAAQSTGHAAAALAAADLSDVVLVNLSRLRGAVVDPVSRTAHVLGGSLWNDVLAAAAPHGLTGLHGSSGDVSVVGLILNGGLSFYARRHGLSVNSVRSVQLVTADGALVRASSDENPDLFWAVRGASGALGIVASIEIELFPYPDVFAGALLWDASRAAEIAHAWAAWTASAPESATTTLRVMHLPPLPELPPFLSGRSLVVIDGAILESDAAADELLAPLRALGPETDLFARIPAAALVGVHMDPPAPTPAFTRHAILDSLPAEALDAWVAESSRPGLFINELRHLGGQIARPAAGGGAITALPGAYLLHAIGVVPAPEAATAVQSAVTAAVEALAPWHSDAAALTFVDSGDVDPRRAFGDATDRVRAIAREWGAGQVFVAAHAV